MAWQTKEQGEGGCCEQVQVAWHSVLLGRPVAQVPGTERYASMLAPGKGVRYGPKVQLWGKSEPLKKRASEVSPRPSLMPLYLPLIAALRRGSSGLAASLAARRSQSLLRRELHPECS